MYNIVKKKEIIAWTDAAWKRIFYKEKWTDWKPNEVGLSNRKHAGRKKEWDFAITGKVYAENKTTHVVFSEYTR